MMRMRSPEDHLDALIGRLERAGEQLRSGELSADAAATLVEECAALAGEASAELERRARAGAEEPERAGHAAVSSACCSGATPDHLREQVDAYLAEVQFADAAPISPGWSEAMRYSLLAPGKRIRPVLALATAIAIGRDPAGGDAARRRRSS